MSCLASWFYPDAARKAQDLFQQAGVSEVVVVVIVVRTESSTNTHTHMKSQK